MLWVPVISSTSKPLMPCHPARARELIRKGRALRRFDKGLFYIKLLDREAGKTQPVILGLDPGSKKEGYTVKSSKHTFLNIQAEAVTWVGKNLELRRILRKNRRYRKTPYRKARWNRRRNFTIPASIKARWDWKIRVLSWLAKRYPVSLVVVEDVKAKTKKFQKLWNISFSPIQIGKNWFYSELQKLCIIRVKSGHDTKEERERLGLVKSKNKLSNVFNAHCVDSWVLAEMYAGGQESPENTRVLCIAPIRVHRRYLHKICPCKGGTRHREGGTVSLGWKKGTWITHSRYGFCYTGGYNSRGQITIHCHRTGARITKTSPHLLTYLCKSSWRLVSK